MNPYLKRLREQYDGLRAGIEGVQNRAVAEGRDLTEDELRSVEGQAEQAKALHKQIEDLTEIEVRNAEVAGWAVRLNGDDDQGDKVRSLGTSSTTARDRDPGHYRSESDGGRHSFFGDLYRARVQGDETATLRLVEHTRALSTGNQGAGTVAPHWLTEEFETIARQGRRLAAAVRNIPLGDDPRPLTLPKQSQGTEDTINEQADENEATDAFDRWDSVVDTVVPKPTTGKQIVSRQLLDMSSPAIDMLIYGDMLEVFDDKVEAKVGAALIVAAGAAIDSFATEAEFTTVAAADSVVDLSVAVLDARKRGADILAMTTNRWGKFKKLKDTTNRPLIPSGTAGPMNVLGVGTVNTLGQIEDLAVIASDGLGNGTTKPESYLAFKASDQILFTSNILRFRFEERSGPESIELGVWGYTAFISRQAGKSVKRWEVTA